ncbi:MAG: TrmB family transcriptional regulator [Euryarchaeota archaeon]|nr:TrmB family transcriptional regulator [Euryarchaeota archaeon]
MVNTRGQIKKDAFDALKKVMVHWGFSEIEATIYSHLLLKRESMTARELSEEIDYAYSSIVNALNQLKRHGMVEREKRGKCYSYSAVFDFVKIIKNERKYVRELLTRAMEDLKGVEAYIEVLEHLKESVEYLGKIDKEVS